MTLPREVRDRILIWTVGNRLMHIKYPSVVYEGSGKEGPNGVQSGLPGFRYRHAICVAQTSEQGAYDAFMTSELGKDKEDPTGVKASGCTRRHQECLSTGKPPPRMLLCEEEKLRLDVTLLLTCRQLYAEADQILWTTNIFSFDDEKSFGEFCKRLNTRQKQSVRSLHFSTSTGGALRYPRHGISELGLPPDSWGFNLQPQSVTLFTGLRNLHLCIYHKGNTNQFIVPAEEVFELIKDYNYYDWQPFEAFRLLELKNITVTVSDSTSSPLCPAGSIWKLTPQDKRQWALEIRNAMLKDSDDEGAEQAQV